MSAANVAVPPSNGQLTQQLEDDGSQHYAPAYVPAGGTGYGLTHGTAAAASTTAIKASAGVLYGLTIQATGTSGSVAVKNNSVTLYTIVIPATAGIYHWPLPIQGEAHANDITLTCTGTGVVAECWYK